MEPSNNSHDYYQRSVDLHRAKQGKLSTAVKIELNNTDDLSLAYTPGVAQVCKVIAADKSEAYNLTLKGNTVAVITDGSAILGLGNLGPEAALPVMEGKCALFKKFANVDAFPICLNTQDTEEIIKTIKYLAPVFGGINLEDIAAPRCFKIEDRLKAELKIPVMHDDQHGTATVVLAGLINATKLRGITKDTAKIVINGAGAAGSAVAYLLMHYGFEDIIVCDSKGSIYAKRPDLWGSKLALAEKTNHGCVVGPLETAVKGRNIFIGVSAPDVLNDTMVRSMEEKPIIFALANPTPEIMPEIAIEAGAFLVATGRSDYPNQINNVLAFPGIFRGALDNKVAQITDLMLVKAAQQLADLVPNPTVEHILPDPFQEGVAAAVALAIK